MKLKRKSGHAPTVARIVWDPGLADYNMGVTHQRAGRWEDALADYDNALRANPSLVHALVNRSAIRQGQGCIAEALAGYDEALRLRPNYKEAHNNRSLCLLALGRQSEALAAADAALAVDAAYADALSTRGIVLQGAARLPEALASYEKALVYRPHDPAVHANRANCLDAMGNFAQALAAYKTAQTLAPQRSESHADVGTCLRRLNRHAEAVSAYEMAVRLAPADPDRHLQLATSYLVTGDLTKGWAEYEWRLAAPDFPEKYLLHDRWDGVIRPGQRVVVRSEQGYGDTLQFARLLPLLSARGCHVTFDCQPGTMSLLRSLDMVGDFVERVDGNAPTLLPGLPQIPLLSLPAYLDIDCIERIPCAIPYLRAESAKSAQWRERLNAECTKQAAVHIGICWAGRATHKRDQYRSAGLERFKSLAGVEGALFVSLQFGGGAAQAPAGMNFVDWTGEIVDYSDTAALVDNLDLVITVDTSIAHLAGVLGKPVWTLLAAEPDWRWLLGREDSPWYPTMRLFRQDALGEWAPVFAVVRRELALFVRDGLKPPDR